LNRWRPDDLVEVGCSYRNRVDTGAARNRVDILSPTRRGEPIGKLLAGREKSNNLTRREIVGLFATYIISDTTLARGGVGAIRPTADPGLVYKEYYDPSKAPKRPELELLIGIGRSVLIDQSQQLGSTPESSVNWPIDLIPGLAGDISGVVLPKIPEPLIIPDRSTARTLDFLVMSRASPPRAKERVTLLLRMAEILQFVNTKGLIHGDINGKNLAWTVTPSPIMYLIDCDGMAPQAPPPSSGVAALGWTDPRLIDKLIYGHDQFSDWYALALAMYRGLLLTPGRLDNKTASGSWPAPSKIPDALSPEISALMRRGLTDPLRVENRPTPQEWVDTLISVYLPNGHFNEVLLAHLDDALVSSNSSEFTPLPATDWSFDSPVARRRVPNPAAQSVPDWQGEPLGVSGAHASNNDSFTPAPSFGSHQSVSANTPLTTIPFLALSALEARTMWHVIAFLISLTLPLIAFITIIVILRQLKTTAPDYPGIARAKLALASYAIVCTLSCVVMVRLLTDWL